MLTITNDGPRIASTSYWQTEHALRGALYLSINAGAFRVLVPPALEDQIPDMATATTVVISRGPWPDQQRDDAIELLFDDGSSSPYALHLAVAQVDRLPLNADAGQAWTCTVWTAGPHGTAVERLSRPAIYRRSKRLPDLRPAGSES